MLYTTEQTAERLMVSEQTVRMWLRDGLLRGTKIGRGRIWRVKEEDIQTFLLGATTK